MTGQTEEMAPGPVALVGMCALSFCCLRNSLPDRLYSTVLHPNTELLLTSIMSTLIQSLRLSVLCEAGQLVDAPSFLNIPGLSLSTDSCTFKSILHEQRTDSNRLLNEYQRKPLLPFLDCLSATAKRV